MKNQSSLLFLLLIFIGCNQHQADKLTVDPHWLDSIKQQSDTSYVKPYRNNEFVTADYFVNRKNNTTCQVMKDSAGTIRQILVVKNGLRMFSAEYFGNGQQKAVLPMDDSGRLHGQGKSFYENGIVKNEGVYQHGFRTGDWINYDEKGKKLSTETYNENGQLVKTTPVQ